MAHHHCLDVSQLACPDPLEKILEHLSRLRPGGFLHVKTRRYPSLLFPMLEKRGFCHMPRSAEGDCCEILVWRRGDREAEAAARALPDTRTPA